MRKKGERMSLAKKARVDVLMTTIALPMLLLNILF